MSIGAVKYALNRYNSTHGVILHIIGEQHELGNVVESAKFPLGQSDIVFPISFSYNAFLIVRLFDLNVNKRQAIHKQSNVRTKFLISIFTRKFCREMECIIFNIIKISHCSIGR